MRFITAPLLAAVLLAGAPSVFAAASPDPTAGGIHYPPGPPLLFRETWKQPPAARKIGDNDGYDDEATRLTPQNLPIVVANPRVEVHVYGTEGSRVRTALHEGRIDLWTGMATSPVAVTVKDKANYMDLTGLARVKWILRTNSVALLHPVVKLADGGYIVARHPIQTNGDFLLIDLPFNDLRWFKLDPEKVVPGVEVKNPDLTRVDEVGMANLAPGGGHGTAGSTNLGDVEVYAKAVRR